jgi:thymidylate kinase
MPLLCLEGASAVGKSTTCRELEQRYNAYIIHEVNVLFKRPENPSTYWYFERQVERWKLAQEKLKNYELVIYDGDIFQPLWYNWSYDFHIYGQTLEFISNFYLEQIQKRNIGFPDGYFLLYNDESELRRRKENDSTRGRGNFEKHLQFIEPQKRYFEIMNVYIPNFVHFIKADTVGQNVKSIFEKVSELPHTEENYSLKLFNYLIDWLYHNKPNTIM